ncbi:MAG: response regulator [Rhodospirillales bacterium]|nr:response regulator [Rhodospirillales bacterium]
MNYGTVKVLLAEGNPQVREAIKTALGESGFLAVSETGNLHAVHDAVTDGGLDLLICDAGLGADDIAELVFRVRHHQAGTNPFISIIVLTADTALEKVRRIIESGADDLLVKPLSVQLLLDRIRHLVEINRQFMVTSDYIGPPRPELVLSGVVGAPRMDVPNPVRAKAVDGSDAASLQRAIDNAALQVNEHKMERHAIQIRDLVDAIVPMYEKKPPDESVVLLLERLLYVSEDISRRLKGTRFAHVSELCLTMLGLARSIGAKPMFADEKDLQLLPKLSQAISRSFLPEEDAAEQLAHDIARTVDKRQPKER